MLARPSILPTEPLLQPDFIVPPPRDLLSTSQSDLFVGLFTILDRILRTLPMLGGEFTTEQHPSSSACLHLDFRVHCVSQEELESRALG